MVADKQAGLRNLSKLIYNSLISYLNLWCNIAAWCEVFSVYSYCCMCFICIYHECTLMHFSLTFLNSRPCRIFETCVPNIPFLWQESEFLCTQYTNVFLTKLSHSYLIDLMKNKNYKSKVRKYFKIMIYCFKLINDRAEGSNLFYDCEMGALSSDL